MRLQNCLGALDGTHIKVTVSTRLKGRYRSRKGDIVTNVLGVCAPDMQFTYILPGWEGSAHDGRVLRDAHHVLRDAISRPNGLQVPQAMDLSGSSTSMCGRGKNKRKWTVVEDNELVNALYEISLDPRWKGEGGFKNGYCSVLETRLAEKLPTSGLSAVPHIESRVRHFRTKYGALEVMLNKSGFNWDGNSNMLQCEKTQYDAHCKYHPEAKGIYGIAFPYYDKLSAIYGSDIATGEGAEGISEAVGNIEQELAAEHDNHQEIDEDRMSRDRMCRDTPVQSTDSASSSFKKRKSSAKGKDYGSVSSDPLLDMLSEVQGDLKGVAKNVGKMAEAMEREAAIQEKVMNNDPQQTLREKVVAELQKLGFTGTEQIKAATVFVRMPDQMSMLLTLDQTLRREFILNMLKEAEKSK